MTIYRRNRCICNSKKPHFCPPSLGEEGFYACDEEDIASRVVELQAAVKDKEDAGIFGIARLTERIDKLEKLDSEHQLLAANRGLTCTEQRKRIAKLEADCADMAEDIIAEAGARHSDGEGGIHPALMGKYRRDTSTARKYIKDKEA